MPELPEVETIARALRQGGRNGDPVVGKRIQSVHLYWEKSLAVPSPEIFKSLVLGQEIVGIDRRGKYLVIILSQANLLFHLRMSGDIRIEKILDKKKLQGPTEKHDRLAIHFEDGVRMAFNDTRKFGRIWYVESIGEVVGHLGPEPFDPGLTHELFIKRLTTHKRQIKPLLLDQSFIAGMGNIYTDEALHRAGIHPRTISNCVSCGQSKSLLDSIREVLSEGIRQNGASIDWVYRGGGFQNNFRVYHRTGQPCPVCGTAIHKIVVGQRGTHFCPKCQPEINGP